MSGTRDWDLPDEAAAMGRGPDDKVTDFGRR